MVDGSVAPRLKQPIVRLRLVGSLLDRIVTVGFGDHRHVAESDELAKRLGKGVFALQDVALALDVGVPLHQRTSVGVCLAQENPRVTSHGFPLHRERQTLLGGFLPQMVVGVPFIQRLERLVTQDRFAIHKQALGGDRGDEAAIRVDVSEGVGVGALVGEHDFDHVQQHPFARLVGVTDHVHRHGRAVRKLKGSVHVLLRDQQEQLPEAGGELRHGAKHVPKIREIPGICAGKKVYVHERRRSASRSMSEPDLSRWKSTAEGGI